MKTKAEFKISQKFHELDVDDFETEREYRKERRRMKRQMSKLRRVESKKKITDD